MMCSNIYLVGVLKSLNLFEGVFPCDKIPPVNFKNEDFKCLIVNTKKYRDNSVGHWLLVTLFRKNNVFTLFEIFDSLGYGKQGVPLQLFEYISRLNINVKYSTVRIQSYTSDFCGLFYVGRFLSNEKQLKFRSYFNSQVLRNND